MGIDIEKVLEIEVFKLVKEFFLVEEFYDIFNMNFDE